MHNPRSRVPAMISLLAALALVSLACSFSAPQVIERTVVVVVTPTPGSQPPGPASTEPASTEAAATTVPKEPGPTQPPASQPPASQPPKPTRPASPQEPSPTPLALKSVPVEGDASRVKGEILYPDVNPATTELVFRVKVRNPKAGNYDGAGIQSVDFSISIDGQEVYTRTEKTPEYCAFGGGEPTCDVFNFASNNYTWPGTRYHLQDGTYTLNVTVHTKSGESWGGQTTFDIKLP